jgi:dipeptidase E
MERVMKLLLTSSGISNASIHSALVDLLGKPIEESNALFIPTGIYPFPNSAVMACRAILGKSPAPLCQLGWKSLGLLELTALPSIDRKAWVASVEEADALLVWGGDVLYLSYWMKQSGLTDLLTSRRRELVYVGVSAGSMVASSIFGETYREKTTAASGEHTSEDIMFATPKGEKKGVFVTAQGAGLVNFALIPHMDHEEHLDASAANAEKWAARLPVPAYAIDDQTAVKVVNGTIEVISEGQWKLFTP